MRIDDICDHICPGIGHTVQVAFPGIGGDGGSFFQTSQAAVVYLDHILVGTVLLQELIKSG